MLLYFNFVMYHFLKSGVTWSTNAPKKNWREIPPKKDSAGGGDTNNTQDNFFLSISEDLSKS